MRYTVSPSTSLMGDITVPGDKSISHRALMLASIARGKTNIFGFLYGEDNLATLNCMRTLGVTIDEVVPGHLTIQGVGKYGLQAPLSVLDCGNAGTAMRLMTGLMAAQSFDSVLTGDQYLLKRPMKRVTDPLSLMGAHIDTTPTGSAPLHVQGGFPLRGINYELPVASAQVKSCLLIAGMYAEGETNLIEPGVTRDHTERMMRAMGYDVFTEGSRVSLKGGGELTACDIQIPGDISSAAFFMVAASIVPGSQVMLKNVGINPTRDGVIQLLTLMGADITFENKRCYGEEPVADIVVRYARLKAITIPEHLVPLAIDEFPVLMIAAACAQGQTILHGAKELCVKETDRIAAMAAGLEMLGLDVHVFDDGMAVTGGVIKGGIVDSFGDHRIAMAFAIAGTVATSPVTITDCDNVATSFPNFFELMQLVRARITFSQ